MKKGVLQTVIINGGILVIYVIAGKFGLSLAFENPSATPIWAPTGIALAATLIFGSRVLPAIFLGAFIVNTITAGTILTSLGIATGNTLEAVVGSYFIKRYANGIHAFENVANIFKYTFLAAVVATTVSANIGVLTLILGGLASWNNFLPVWITWWLGDMGGNLIIAPLLLVWWTHPRIPLNSIRGIHFSLSLLLIFIITGLIFYNIVPYPYLYIPVAVWIAFWFGRRGATVSTIIVASITIYFTLHRQGPFSLPSINASLVQLQLFLNVFSFTSLIFAATVLTIRKNESVIAKHEERFQTIIEKSSDAIFLVDASSKILYASPSVKRMLGYTPEELRGMTGFDLVAPEDKKLTISVLAEIVLKPNGSSTVEARLIRKDKTILWVEATGTNLLLDPAINAVVVNFHDITEKKLSRDKMLTEKLEDEAMLSSIGEGIIATDYKGEITMANLAACSLLGWKEEELIGHRLVDAIPMQDETGKTLAPPDRPITKVLTLKRSIVTSPTNYYIKKDQTKFPVRFTVTPIILDEDVVGTIEVFYDITKEKEIDKAKSEFVSVASHQLRTPLTTINWYIEELIRTGKNLTEKQSNYLNEVYSASKRMITLINALLNVSRIELGTVMVEPSPTDILKLADQVIQDYILQLNTKRISLEKNYQAGLPTISADAKLLTIIIQNLISNAIKYSKIEGKIELQISHNSEEFILKVSDHGYGIPKNQQAKIFTKMFRADNARNVSPDGNGLGLYIVKAITDATNGKIWFKSEENKGTSFFISYPLTGMQKKNGKIMV